MTLYIKWRYPNEEEKHEARFTNINPKKTNISYGFLYFESYEDPNDKHWNFPINHIIEMRMEEE